MTYANKKKRGFTLIEILVSVAIFGIIMALASGAYILIINVNRSVQGVTTGINNLSFALESMTRTIRTSTNFTALSGSSFRVLDSTGNFVTYSLSNSAIIEQRGSNAGAILTEPAVRVDSLSFVPTGLSANDLNQARVTIVLTGTVNYGVGQNASFTIETGATMRGTDLP